MSQTSSDFDPARTRSRSHALFGRRWLRILPLSCLVVPAMAFLLVASWRYMQLWQEAEVRLDRAGRIATEHVRRVLDTTESLLHRVEDAATSAAQVDNPALRQAMLHRHLSQMAQDKPQLLGIYMFDAQGLTQASSRVHPAPPDSVTQRDFFAWHREGRGGLFVSQPLVTRSTGEPVFDVSMARHDVQGSFQGVISVALAARYFGQFHSDLIDSEPGLAVAVVREDGGVFVRTPKLARAPRRLADTSDVLARIRAGETAGSLRALSTLDGGDRLFSFRKVEPYPMFVVASLDALELHRRWLRELGLLALFGLPTSLGLFFAVRAVIQRSAASLETARKLRESALAQKEMQAALLQAQKLEALGRVTGGVAHDFNNALMVISNSLTLLKLRNPQLKGAYLESMDRALRASTQLTRQLLAFSRRQALVPEPVRLQEQLPGMADLLRPVLGSRIKLEIEVGPDTPAIRIDVAEFELGLINLALNARDAMNGQGQFVLRAGDAGALKPASLSGSMVLVEARDTGSGIAPEHLEKVFDPFFTTKPLGEGTGLGLSQVYGLCQRAGGGVALSSRPGEGCAVRMFLPVHEQAQPQRAPHDRDSLPGASNRRVLMVEDNAEVAAVLLALLQQVGCDVTHADRATGALALLEQDEGRFDVLLTDVVMPGNMDGLSLAQLVQQRWPRLGLVVMTGYSDRLEELAATGLKVLPKPCSLDMLARALEEATACIA